MTWMRWWMWILAPLVPVAAFYAAKYIVRGIVSEGWFLSEEWLEKRKDQIESLLLKTAVSSALGAWQNNFWAGAFCFGMLLFIEKLYQQHHGSSQP